MSDPTNQAAPGWYPAAAGSTQLRWWDGSQWTNHVHETVARDGLGYSPATPPKAPAGTNPNTVFGWLVPLTPLLSIVSLPIYFASAGNAFKVYMSQAINNPGSASNSASSLALTQALISPTYLAVFFLGLVAYVLGVIFAYLDWKALKAKGVPSPFHWAWNFLESPLVYVIGRSVVVRRRTGTGLGPLWVMIAVIVVGFIVSLVGFAILGSALGSLN